MRRLSLVWVGLVIVAVGVADDQMVGQLQKERSRLLARLRQVDEKIAAEQGRCPHPAEKQKIDRHIYIGDEFICQDCGDRRSTWPSLMTFEDGRYRPTSEAEFAAAKEYLERVERANSRRLRNADKTSSQPRTAPIPGETPEESEYGYRTGLEMWP
tara:strand:+ start:173 stop:640 length:468 start_codon:yes stop_codon:yes gene_type:complete